MSSSSSRPLCLVAGVGPGIGSALVHKFAAQGYTVFMLARSAAFLQSLSQSLSQQQPPLHAIAYPCDLSDHRHIQETMALIQKEQHLHPSPSSSTTTTRTTTTTTSYISVFLFNCGQRRLALQPIESISDAEMHNHFIINALSYHRLLTHILPPMKQHQHGTIIVTSATAAIRSRAGLASFTASKSALRAMVACTAQEAGKYGVHVTHAIIDAVVDTPISREYVERQKRKAIESKEGRSSSSSNSSSNSSRRSSSSSAIESEQSTAHDVVLASPACIADEYWKIHTQNSSTWTFELDLRPFNEPIAARM